MVLTSFVQFPNDLGNFGDLVNGFIHPQKVWEKMDSEKSDMHEEGRDSHFYTPKNVHDLSSISVLSYFTIILYSEVTVKK